MLPGKQSGLINWGGLLFPWLLVQKEERKYLFFPILFVFHYTINLHKQGVFF